MWSYYPKLFLVVFLFHLFVFGFIIDNKYVIHLKLIQMSHYHSKPASLLKNKRFLLGTVIFILGAVFMFIPFIPLGYVLLAVGAFLLYPVFPPLKRLLDYLRKKDRSNKIQKAQKKTEALLGENTSEDYNKE